MSDVASRIERLSPKQRELLLRRLGQQAAPTAAEARIPRQPRRPGETHRFPVSFSQLREWILDQLDPGTAAYNIPSHGRISGPLSVPALSAGVQEIVRRHEALRTTFAYEGSEPVQVVAPDLSLAVPLIDLEGLPETAREAEAGRLARGAVAQPFDLARGPLLRVRLVRVAEREHLLLCTMHHIVSDGWSVGVFLGELGALYRAFASGRPSPLPELPVQYGDFAAWQRERLQGERLEAQVSYWQRQLAGAPPLLRLPTDRPRPPVQTFRGAHQPVGFGRELTGALRDLAGQEGTSLFVAVLALFQTLLGRWSGQEDLTVGTYSGNRGRAELEGLIGFFVNTLVLRGDLSGDPGFRDLVRRLREVTLGAFEHGEVPFERLLESLRVERSLAHTPLFQATLMLQNFPAAAVDSSEVTLGPLPVADDRANFDLTLGLWEGGGELGGSLEYNVDLFDRTTLQRMAGHLEALAAAVAADPDRPLSALPLLSSPERHQTLVEWNDTADPGDAGSLPVHRLVEARARHAPGAEALVSESGRLTYGEMYGRVERLAARLRAAGVGSGAVVGVCLDRSFELIVALLAVLGAGGAYLPLDPEYPPERLGLMLEDSGAEALLTREGLVPGLGDRGVKVLRVDEEGSAVPVVPVAPSPAAGPDGLCYVIYTSGSTGRPKGVMVRHGSLARYAETARRSYGIRPGDRVLQFASISFDTSAEEIYPTLISGAALVLRTEARPEEPPELFARLERLGVTVLDLPTAYWHELVAAMERDVSLTLPACVRLVILGGERALPARLRVWQERVGERVTLVNTYGPTEATIVATRADLRPRPAEPPDAEVPIGGPIRDARVYLLDASLRPVPMGVYGELYIGGAGVARGYLARPDLTADRFVPGPCPLEEPGARLYRTGDLARFRADGRLEFGGRVDQQVKVRGFRIEPGEVEAALAAHPGVEEAVVAARPDVAGGQRLVAWVVLRPQTPGEPPVNVTELRSAVRERLPEHMVPSAFVPLAELPRLPNGKLDRRSLPEPGGERPDLAAAYVAPESDVERVIAAVWRDLLRVDRIGLHDNFFELGGHSLLLVQAHGRLKEALGRDVAVVDLFRFPTVSLLARHLGGESGGAAVQKAQDLGGKQRAAISRQKQAMAAAQARLKKR